MVHRCVCADDASIGDVVEMLQGDPLLAGEVYAFACQPLYSRRRSPKSLQEAALHLGLARFDDVVQEVTLRSILHPERDSRLEQTFLASVITAHVTRALGLQSRRVHRELFFTGLLHDVGTTCWLLVEPDVDLDLLDAGRARATEQVLSRWPISTEVRRAIQDLRGPPTASAETELGEMLKIGAYLARCLIRPETQVQPSPSALQALSLSHDDVSNLLTSAQRLVHLLAPNGRLEVIRA